MNSRERVLATINFEPVDRPAVFPLEGTGWINRRAGYSYADTFEMADLGAADIVQGFDDMRSDVIFCGGSAWMAWGNTFGSPVDASRPGMPINVDAAFAPDKTPADMSDDEIEARLRDNYYVKAMMNQIKAVKKIAGPDKIIMSGHTGPFTGAGVLVSPKKLMVMLAKMNRSEENKKALLDLLDFATRCLSIYGKLLHESGTDILNICDPVASGDMISLEMFEALCVPEYTKYRELMTDKDWPILVHICGNAGNRVEKIRDFGAKCFSVDTIVDMEDMLKRCDHQMCMVGNLDNSNIMMQGTPDDVYRESTKLLELGKANGGGLIVCTGCELPPMTSLENILAMVRATEDAYA